MANEQNLIPFTSEQSREEAKKNGSKGGKASGEARRRRKAFAEAFNALLEHEYTDSSGKKLQGVELIAAKTFRSALDGDLKAMQIIRDTVGEMPVQRVEQVNIDEEYRKSVEYIKEVMRSSE